MRIIKCFGIILCFIALCYACKKTDSVQTLSSLNIVQAAVSVNSIAVSFATSPIPFHQNQAFISFGSSAEYGLQPGKNPLVIVSADDTTKSLVSASFDLKPGKIYSFYLAGQAAQIDTLFMQDIIRVYTDSSAGLRFINLSPDSKPVSINLVGNPSSQTEFAGLGYKEISAFKSYSATSSVGGVYNFEIRDQASDSLLTTFSWTYGLQKNNTVVISGLEASGLTLFQVNNY